MKKLILLLTITLPVLLSAQMPTPIQWNFELKKNSADEYEVLITADLDEGWSIYSAHLDPDAGPIATSISFSVPESLSLIGEIKEEGKKVEGFDEIFGAHLIKYKTQVVFSQKIKAEELDLLEGSVRFMTCDDHKCLPPTQIPFELQPE